MEDVERIAAVAAGFAARDEELAAVLPVEVSAGDRVYLCAFTTDDAAHTWLVLDAAGTPVTSRKEVRDAAAIAALVEVAEESGDAEPREEPRIASLAYLDSLGAGAHGNVAAALKSAVPVVDELTKDVEGNYKLELI